jgi:hypothetical protein
MSRARPRARAELHEVARQRIAAPHEILDWAKRDRRWSFTLAEVLRDPTERPRDLAARLVLAIADELEQERETLYTDTADSPPRPDDVTNVASPASLFAIAD